ncbi:ATP-binding protein [Streptomyces yerevanensis]|uniref:ATP-binding protein n=1 Tax=Streptomyces yerevanensis TaxID=66378 RepID=UPI0007C53C41|nr:ATP-binding protein [Streptomyces yerevanensis]
MQQTRERHFTPHPASVAHARSFVADTLNAWELGDRLDDVRLCVSELATNAVEHATSAGQDFRVRVAHGEERLRVEVRDQGGGTPTVRHATTDDCHGRGLLLVAALADDWGASREGASTTVWAEFKLGASTAPLVDHTRVAARAATLPVSAGLFASLGVWTWIGADAHGDPLGIVLLVHPPARRHGETDERIEQQMRALSDAFGLVEAGKPLTDIGPRVTIHHGARILLRPEGSHFGVQVPAHPRLVRLLTERGELAVAVGLDPLAIGAPPAEVDLYVDRGLPANRLLLGRAQAAASLHAIRTVEPPHAPDVR